MTPVGVFFICQNEDKCHFVNSTALCRAYAMEETPEPTDDAVQVALEIMRAATKRIVSVGGHGM